jgi:hypothetical protein
MAKKGLNKVQISHLLSILPIEQLNKIAVDTKVNYYSKILDGQSLFYLLLFSLIECQRNSLRTMEDIFGCQTFKFLFNLDKEKTVKFNSISERLSVVNVIFFEKVYDSVFATFSSLYNWEEIEKQNLIRVDSTMVAEAANKLKQGLSVGVKDGKKQLKYTFAYNGNFPVMTEIFTTQEYLSEDKAIPKVVYQYAQKQKSSIFIFDRGVQKRDVFDTLTKEESFFVTRLNATAKYNTTEVIEENTNRKIGNLSLIRDSKVQLRIPNHRTFYENQTRLIEAVNPENGVIYFFLTNIFDKTSDEILAFYKKRWDIEVYFRFIKQELNFSHITSTSENGMKVMLYMTMIASMLVLIYKRMNNVGYKTAVRRISIELNEFIIKMVVKHCGGDPSLVFR